MYRILLVEPMGAMDEGLLEKMLDWTSLQCEVVGRACDGREALRMFKMRHPDIIIGDVNLPDMPGVEMFRHIRALSADVQFILLTACESLEYARQAMDLGACAYLLRCELGPVRLRAVLRRAQENVRAQRQLCFFFH